MDQSALVVGGQALVRAMDADNLRPRVAMWVHNTDMDTWKLWLVPPRDQQDKRDFYRRIAEIVAKNRPKFGGVDASDTEMIAATHPAMKGLGGFVKMPDLGSVYFSGNRFNGFYLPDGIVLRSDL